MNERINDTSSETSNETTQILEHQLEDQRKARAELEQELTQKDTKIAQLEQELTEALTHEVESKTKEEAAPWRDRYERLRGILQRSEDEKKIFDAGFARLRTRYTFWKGDFKGQRGIYRRRGMTWRSRPDGWKRKWLVEDFLRRS